jgi:hypothetical protein
MPDLKGHPRELSAVRARNQAGAFRLWQKPTLERCVERADALGVRRAAAHRCRSLLPGVRLAVADAALDPGATGASTPPGQAGPTLQDPPWQATKRLGDCAYAGSVRPGVSCLHSDASSDAKVACLDSGSVLRVDRLEAAPAGAGPMRVALSRATARRPIDSSSGALALRGTDEPQGRR